jgi:hypothetical protein
MSRGLRDLEARGQRPAARSPPLVEGDPRGPETFSAEPALEGLLLTHSRPCACGPRLGPSGGHRESRIRSTTVEPGDAAHGRSVPGAEIDHTGLRASAKYGLRQAASSGQETINWFRSSSGQTWGFRASVFVWHGDQDKSTAEFQHSDSECRGDGNQVWCRGGRRRLIATGRTATPRSTSPGLGAAGRHEHHTR